VGIELESSGLTTGNWQAMLDALNLLDARKRNVTPHHK
jgi:hypothetical protein